MRTFVRPGLVCLASNPETKMIFTPAFRRGIFLFKYFVYV